MIELIAICNKNSFSLSLLKSRSTRRLGIWSSLRSLRHISTNKYNNRFIQSISCRRDPSVITTSLRLRSQSFLSNSCLVRQQITSLSSMAFTADQRGAENSTDFRIYFSKTLIALKIKFISIKPSFDIISNLKFLKL